MNVDTLKIDRFEAEVKMNEYQSLNPKTKTAEDEQMEAVFRAVMKTGARVINVAAGFKQTGLNEKGQPKMALARADWKHVNFNPRVSFNRLSRWNFERPAGGGGFSPLAQWNSLARNQNCVLPAGTFDDTLLIRKTLRSYVPHIPPNLRPKYKLSNYHILFEVESWEEYPVDPFLLRRIHGNLFLIEAEWELTKLEAELLKGIITGS